MPNPANHENTDQAQKVKKLGDISLTVVSAGLQS
jgi:hypothetical protein